MILLDFNGIVVANILVNKLGIDEALIRHMILNTIRAYRKKFHREYGEMVICCDHGGNWRREVYPEYKAGRKTARDESSLDWSKIFDILNKVRDEIRDNFPYKVVHVWKCEADDVIAALCENTQEFGSYEKVLIISSDKDFAQLQKWENVKQFSPTTKQFIVESDPEKNLFQHICKGDSSDGVPNVLSSDRTFVDGHRQNNMSQKRIDAWRESPHPLNVAMDRDTYRNFMRNKKMIDLSEIPVELKEEIINTYRGQTVPKGKVLKYLMDNKLSELFDKAGDFV